MVVFDSREQADYKTSRTGLEFAEETEYLT